MTECTVCHRKPTKKRLLDSNNICNECVVNYQARCNNPVTPVCNLSYPSVNSFTSSAQVFSQPSQFNYQVAPSGVRQHTVFPNPAIRYDNPSVDLPSIRCGVTDRAAHSTNKNGAQGDVSVGDDYWSKLDAILDVKL